MTTETEANTGRTSWEGRAPAGAFGVLALFVAVADITTWENVGKRQTLRQFNIKDESFQNKGDDLQPGVRLEH